MNRNVFVAALLGSFFFIEMCIYTLIMDTRMINQNSVSVLMFISLYFGCTGIGISFGWAAQYVQEKTTYLLFTGLVSIGLLTIVHIIINPLVSWAIPMIIFYIISYQFTRILTSTKT